MLGLLVECALRSLALGVVVWLGLALLRVRNPHAHMTAWTVVLVASLAMPFLAHRLTLTIPAAPPSSPVVEALTSAFSIPPAKPVSAPAPPAPTSVVSSPSLPAEAVAPPALAPAIVNPLRAPPPPPRSAPIDWWSFLTGIYAVVAGVLLLRLAVGLVLTWRMARAAQPIREGWTGGADVRVSDVVGVPVTVGSTVLLPPEYVHWSPAKLRAVLSHEGSHVARGDFYVLLLAAINRAVFWFNPFAWWQLVRLAELAEIISDDAALELLEDRPSYAFILLDVAGNVGRAPAAIAMARACTVGRRIERILAGAAAPARMGPGKRALVAAALAPMVAISAGSIAFGVAPARDDVVAPGTVRPGSHAAHPFDSYVGYYAADPKVLPDLVLTVTREGDHLFVHRTGLAKLEVFPESKRTFFFGVIDQRISFLPDGSGVVLYQNGMEIAATRVDAAAARHAAELFDRRFADQATARTAVEVDPALFDRYVGFYELDPRCIITVTREGDKLFAQLSGWPKRRLMPASEREYFYKFVAGQITFVADGDGPATALVLHQNGREFPSLRVDAARAAAIDARVREINSRRAEHARPRTAAAVDPNRYERYAGLYQRGPNSIFTITREGDRLFAQLTGQPKLEVLPENDHEFFYKAVAAQITFVADGEQPATELILHQDGNDLRAARVAGVPRVGGGRNHKPEARLLDSHVGWYEIGARRALAVTRADDYLVLQETGRPKIEMLAYGDREFVSKDGGSFVSFMPDGQGRSGELLLHEPSPGARRAVRIDPAKAQAIEAVFARRFAAAPERFRDQAPAEGGRAAVLRAIDELQRGAPSYDRMSAQLADDVRRQIRQLHAMLTALGAVESVFFRGVGPGGYDIYGAKFAKGFAEFRMLLGPDGTTEDMIFRPDGDDTPGGTVACAQEQTLKRSPGTAPIKLLLYNASGADIRVFELDFEGKRARHILIGDDRSAPLMTYISRPWVVTDASGQCREIILPGHSTRYLAISPPGTEATTWAMTRRTSPTSGSEDALRRYIDAISRGEPDYDRMTPEVAAETRRQLLLNQAILSKLGAVRAMSFRGVSPLGSDIYIVQFANGSAEWRIGLVKQGRIGRVALGPQY